MKNVIYSLVVIMLVSMTPIALSGKSPKKTDEISDKLKKILAKGETGEKQKEKLLHERKNIIDGLIKILKDDKKSREVRIRAAFLLGEYRAEEAIPVLFDNLLLRLEKVEDETKRDVNSPCMDALVKIGKKASFATFERISKFEQGLGMLGKYNRYLHSLIMIKVEGKEVAAFMIRSKLKELKGKELKSAQAFLEEYFTKEKKKKE